MKWNRRHFIGVLGGFVGMVCTGIGVRRALPGKAEFDDWRSLPGMSLGLELDVASPSSVAIDLVARHDGREHLVRTYRGAQHLDVEVPFVETQEESYELYAVVRDPVGRRLQSDVVEVLAQPFQFGL